MKPAASFFVRRGVVVGRARDRQPYRRLEPFRGHEPLHQVGLEHVPHLRVRKSEDKPAASRRIKNTNTDRAMFTYRWGGGAWEACADKIRYTAREQRSFLARFAGLLLWRAAVRCRRLSELGRHPAPTDGQPGGRPVHTCRFWAFCVRL